MNTISQKFFQAVKLSPVQAYRLAISVGLHPNTLSKILHGAVVVRPDDARLIKLGALVGLKPEEIFENGKGN